MKLLVAPHNDDEVLWCTFTLLREKPMVLIVFDGHVQANRGVKVTMLERRNESMAAMATLGLAQKLRLLRLRDDDPTITSEMIHRRIEAMGAEEIYAPAEETFGHPQHNLVARACDGLPVAKRYLTYTPTGKSTSAHEVPILDASWIALKLRALACYTSQHSLDPRMGCWPHFMRDQREYYAA